MATNISYLAEQIIALKSLPKGVENFTAYLSRMDRSRGKRISRLFHYLEKHHENFDEEDACYFVFGNHDTKKPAWRKLRNDLGAVLEKYVLTEKMYLDETLRLRKKLEMGRDLHLKKIFEKAEKEADKQVFREEIVHYDFWADIHFKRYFIDKGKLDPKDGILLDACAQNLSVSFIIKYFVVAIEQIIRRKIERKPYREISEKLSLLLPLAQGIKVPIIALLVVAANFFLEPNHDNYQKFKTVFLREIPCISSFRLILYKFMMSALAFSKFKGDLFKETHALHKLGIEMELVKENGRIPTVLFNNMVINAHRLNEITFLKRFLKGFAACLRPDKYKDSSLKLARLYLAFCQGKYAEVLSGIPQVENITPSFTLKKQVLELKALYEIHKNKYDAFVEIDKRDKKFWNLIRRHKKDGHMKEIHHPRYLNFYNLLSKTAKHDGSAQSKAELQELYDSYSDNIAESRWLKQIIRRLPLKVKRTR